ncbi:effector-associated domain EAD1-containing protein [Actinomadura luteofluorescens]|uniref:effector-associated domain EAD1-containing protein n=1 Tax=Actinomadura luteofluorescens TaxID=46163 RepID=UPI00348687BE
MDLLDAPSFTLDDPGAEDLFELLCAAYGDVQGSQMIVSKAGMDLSCSSWTEGMRKAWWAILQAAAKERKLRRLVEAAADDPTRVGYRDRFRAFFASPAPGREVHPADWDPFQLGVHRPIAVIGPAVPPLTPYVMRDHDRMPSDVVRPARSLMIVFAGGSATGKTRAALEVARNHFAGWTLTQPLDAAHLVEKVTAGEISARTVLWLDRLALYMDGDGRVAMLLRRLMTESGAGPVAIIGTASQEDVRNWTEEGAEGHAHVRALLHSAHVFPVPDMVPVFERDAWRTRDDGDPRLAAACASAGASGKIVQALAGGTALIERYETLAGPTGAYERTVITAAMDLRRLGLLSPVRRDLLAAVAEAYPEAKAHAADLGDWFQEGLLSALRPVHSISPLEKVASSPHESYLLHTFLEQHGKSRRQGALVPAGVWERLLEHALPAEDALRIAREAHRRGLHRDAVRLALPVADEGHVEATVTLAPWLERAGLVEEAGERLAASAETGHPQVLRCFAEWLERHGENTEAESAWRRAAAAGDGAARTHVAAQYARSGQVDMVRELWLQGAQEGDHEARHRLVELLYQDGDLTSVEKWLKIGAGAGDLASLEHLVALLDRDGREEEADRFLRASLNRGAQARLIDRLVVEGRTAEALEVAREAGDAGMSLRLADALKREGLLTELEEYLTAQATAGNPAAVVRLVALLDDTDRSEQAETWLYRMMATGDDRGLATLLRRLDRTRREEADDRLRRLAESGRPAAMRRLALRARQAEVIEYWLQRAAEAGDAHSLHDLVRRSVQAGRTADVRTWLEHRADQGSIIAVRELTGLAGSRADAERWSRRAIEIGVPAAVDDLARLLVDTGRQAEAERLQRYGIVPGGATCDPWPEAPQVTAERTDGGRH